MKNIKKALVFVVSILLIFAFANFSFASSITAKNSTNTSENSATGNSTDDSASGDSTDNTPSNNSTSNRITNNSSSLNSVNQTSNLAKSINTTNSSEDLPHTGIDKTDFNVAMILLLALVLSMFSLVQYRKISKKDE